MHLFGDHLKPEEYICFTCDKCFKSEKKLRQHEEDEHITCAHPGCMYTGPAHVMVIHRLKHYLVNAQGESVMDSLPEIAEWLAARRANFPTQARRMQMSKEAAKKGYHHRLEMPPLRKSKSVLERILRETLQSAYGRRLLHPATYSSAFCPQLPKMLSAPPSCHPGRRCMPLPSSPYCTTAALAPSSFLVRPGRRQTEVVLRPPLLYQLLAPEIREYEAKLVQAICFIVKSNFFSPEEDTERQEEQTVEKESIEAAETRQRADEEGDAGCAVAADVSTTAATAEQETEEKEEIEEHQEAALLCCSSRC